MADSEEYGVTDVLAGAAKWAGNNLVNAAEAAMDVHPLARVFGTAFGLESPKMRREALADQADEMRMRMAGINMQGARTGNELAQLKLDALRQQYEDAQTDRRADPYYTKVRMGLGGELRAANVSPAVYNEIMQGDAGRMYITTNAMMDMLDSDNPDDTAAAAALGRRLGFDVYQTPDGKRYISGNGLRYAELTQENSQKIRDDVHRRIAEYAKGMSIQEQKAAHVDGIAFNDAVETLVQNGVPYQEAVGRAHEVVRRFAPKGAEDKVSPEIVYHGALRAALQAFTGKMDPARQAEYTQQMEIIANKFGVQMDERGNIEGKPALDWVREKLDKDPVEQAYRSLIRSSEAEMRNRLAMAAMKQAKGGGGAEDGLGEDAPAEPTAQDKEIKYYEQQGRELAKARGMEGWAEQVVHRHNLREDDENKQLTPGVALEALGRAQEIWLNADNRDAAMKMIKNEFKELGLGERDVPAFFDRVAGDEKLSDARSKSAALARKFHELKKQYRGSFSDLLKVYESNVGSSDPLGGMQLGRPLTDEEVKLLDTYHKYMDNADRLAELTARRRADNEADEQERKTAEAQKKRREERLKKLTGKAR